ncbi:MAG: UDP-N-acetylmuramate--L-alanine ligase [Bacteroidales bacterium]|jgi:UDP-N-acetylmuramate--alanine ligase|nr:UDP-N-acetylmuramate--L-alanine ligase [Bacteroidales bacterium]
MLQPLENIKRVYFLGIGGIGMSALAQFFLQYGAKVFGYDLTPTPLTDQLIKMGAVIHFTEQDQLIPDHIDLVVLTPAIPKEHKELLWFQKQNIPILKRAEVLGLICQSFPTIAVAGTHGKTTTTSMVTHFLNSIHHPTLAFIGGISKNLNSNFLYTNHFQTVVVEADEFDRSFLTLYPKIGIITSVDADHLDIYGEKEQLISSFQAFANQIDRNGTLIIAQKIAHLIDHPNKITYGVDETADFFIKIAEMEPENTHFAICKNTQSETPVCFHNLVLKAPGVHNLLNSLAAFLAVKELLKLNIAPDHVASCNMIFDSFATWAGVARRFDYRIVQEDLIYIDDYAHHPEEIKAFLQTIKTIYPQKKATGIFQPHLYSRTRDFAEEFAQALNLLDEIILLEIYPARELPIQGIDSHYLLQMIPNPNKKVVANNELIPYLKQQKPELLLTIGAGNIDQFVPLIENEFHK